MPGQSESNFTLTDLDYEARRRALIEYLRTKEEFLDYNFSGSTINLLVELLAYNNYNTSFAINMLANEAFMDTANLRDNVVKKAREIGYTPKSTRASFADLTFNLSSAPGNRLTLRAGTGFNTTLDEVVYSYVALNDVIAVAGSDGIANFNNRFYEGNLLSQTFIFNNRLSQRFIINNQNVDSNTISVKVGTRNGDNYETYIHGKNIVDLDSDSKVFFIEEIEDGKYEILFGDGSIGKKLEDNSRIIIEYLVTKGPEANGAKSFTFSGIIDAVDVDGNSITLSNIQTVPNPVLSESLGGALPENMNQIKRNSRGLYNAQNRAVTLEDYKSIIASIYPNELDIIVYSGEDKRFTEYGTIYISVKSRDNKYISLAEKEYIKRELKQYTINNILLRIVDPSELNVEINSDIIFNRSFYPNTFTLSSIRNEIISELQNYIKEENISDFNRMLFKNKIESVIDNSQESFRSVGVDFILRKDFVPQINSKAFYEVCYQNKLLEGSIISTDFNVLSNSSFSERVYIADDSNGNLDLKSAVLLDPIQDRTIVKDIGTVDYEEGEIMMNDLYILDHKGLISIRAKGVERDVRVYREAYINVDLSKSNFNLVAQ